MFYFIFCSFGATTTTYSKLTPYSTPYTKLATTPPPPQQHTPPTALAIQRGPCGDTPRGTDGDAAWRRRDVPLKRPRGSRKQKRIVLICLVLDMATKTHLPDLPDSEARKGRGRGSVSSPDWRTRIQRAQKRSGRSAGRTCRKRAREKG